MLFNIKCSHRAQRTVLHFLEPVLILFIMFVVDTTQYSNRYLYKGDTELVLFKFACLTLCVKQGPSVIMRICILVFCACVLLCGAAGNVYI